MRRRRDIAVILLLLTTYQLDQTNSLTNPTDRNDFTDRQTTQTQDEGVQLTDRQTDRQTESERKSTNSENLDELVNLQLANNEPITEKMDSEQKFSDFTNASKNLTTEIKITDPKTSPNASFGFDGIKLKPNREKVTQSNVSKAENLEKKNYQKVFKNKNENLNLKNLTSLNSTSEILQISEIFASFLDDSKNMSSNSDNFRPNEEEFLLISSSKHNLDAKNSTKTDEESLNPILAELIQSTLKKEAENITVLDYGKNSSKIVQGTEKVVSKEDMGQNITLLDLENNSSKNIEINKNSTLSNKEDNLHISSNEEIGENISILENGKNSSKITEANKKPFLSSEDNFLQISSNVETGKNISVLENGKNSSNTEANKNPVSSNEDNFLQISSNEEIGKNITQVMEDGKDSSQKTEVKKKPVSSNEDNFLLISSNEEIGKNISQVMEDGKDSSQKTEVKKKPVSSNEDNFLKISSKVEIGKNISVLQIPKNSSKIIEANKKPVSSNEDNFLQISSNEGIGTNVTQLDDGKNSSQKIEANKKPVSSNEDNFLQISLNEETTKNITQTDIGKNSSQNIKDKTNPILANKLELVSSNKEESKNITGLVLDYGKNSSKNIEEKENATLANKYEFLQISSSKKENLNLSVGTKNSSKVPEETLSLRPNKNNLQEKNSTSNKLVANTNFQFNSANQNVTEILQDEEIESLPNQMSSNSSFDDLPIEEDNFDRHMPVLAEDDNDERMEHRVNLGGEDLSEDTEESPERREVEDAVDFGLRKMHELILVKEPELYKKGIWLESQHPAMHVAAFNTPSEQALKLARYGYASLQAAAKLAQNHRTLGRNNPEFRNSFRETLLHSECPLRGIPRCRPAARRYRTADGTCNNLENPWRGAANTPQQRFLPPRYDDGLSTVRKSVLGGPLPSPRQISTTIHSDRDIEMSPVTLMLMQWGQFIDHDLTASAQSRGFNGSVPRCCANGGQGFQQPNLLHPDCLPIPVPANDWFFGRFGIRCLEFVRSAPTSRIDCDLGWREQINQVTSYLDASPIYGNAAGQSDSQRVFFGGRLQNHRLDPHNPEDPPGGNVCNMGAITADCFRPGDGRVRETPALTSFHIVWTRKHNQLAGLLEESNPHWSDEKIYQEARRIVGATVQHITYREFLPIILGQEVMRLFDLKLLPKGYHNDYDPEINPSAANSFTAAAFRFGHSLVQKSLVRSDIFHRPLFNNVSLHEEQSNPQNIWSKGSVDRLLLGMCNQPSQRRDEFITDELTNHLFQTPGFFFGMDLAAINIQRGRDHGIPPYIQWRKPCGLSPITSFADLARVMSFETAEKFRTIYNSIEDIDLYSAGLAEKPVRGGLVGPTFACIIAQQFSNLRKGDRFWYENGNLENSFTPAQLQQIRKITFAEVVCDTMTEVQTIQPFVFLSSDGFSNKREDCKNLRSFDIRPWEENINNLVRENLGRKIKSENPKSKKTEDFVRTETLENSVKGHFVPSTKKNLEQSNSNLPQMKTKDVFEQNIQNFGMKDSKIPWILDSINFNTPEKIQMRNEDILVQNFGTKMGSKTYGRQNLENFNALNEENAAQIFDTKMGSRISKRSLYFKNSIDVKTEEILDQNAQNFDTGSKVKSFNSKNSNLPKISIKITENNAAQNAQNFVKSRSKVPRRRLRSSWPYLLKENQRNSVYSQVQNLSRSKVSKVSKRSLDSKNISPKVRENQEKNTDSILTQTGKILNNPSVSKIMRRSLDSNSNLPKVSEENQEKSFDTILVQNAEILSNHPTSERNSNLRENETFSTAQNADSKLEISTDPKYSNKFSEEKDIPFIEILENFSHLDSQSRTNDKDELTDLTDLTDQQKDLTDRQKDLKNRQKDQTDRQETNPIVRSTKRKRPTTRRKSKPKRNNTLTINHNKNKVNIKQRPITLSPSEKNYYGQTYTVDKIPEPPTYKPRPITVTTSRPLPNDEISIIVPAQRPQDLTYLINTVTKKPTKPDYNIHIQINYYLNSTDKIPKPNLQDMFPDNPNNPYHNDFLDQTGYGDRPTKRPQFDQTGYNKQNKRPQEGYSTTKRPYQTTKRPTTKRPYYSSTSTYFSTTTRKPYYSTSKNYYTTKRPYTTTERPYSPERPYYTIERPYYTTSRPYVVTNSNPFSVFYSTTTKRPNVIIIEDPEDDYNRPYYRPYEYESKRPVVGHVVKIDRPQIDTDHTLELPHQIYYINQKPVTNLDDKLDFRPYLNKYPDKNYYADDRPYDSGTKFVKISSVRGHTTSTKHFEPVFVSVQQKEADDMEMNYSDVFEFFAKPDNGTKVADKAESDSWQVFNATNEDLPSIPTLKIGNLSDSDEELPSPMELKTFDNDDYLDFVLK